MKLKISKKKHEQNNSGQCLPHENKSICQKRLIWSISFRLTPSNYKELMVTDIQGVSYCLFDPEIALTQQADVEDKSVFYFLQEIF